MGQSRRFPESAHSLGVDRAEVDGEVSSLSVASTRVHADDISSYALTRGDYLRGAISVFLFTVGLFWTLLNLSSVVVLGSSRPVDCPAFTDEAKQAAYDKFHNLWVQESKAIPGFIVAYSILAVLNCAGIMVGVGTLHLPGHWTRGLWRRMQCMWPFRTMHSGTFLFWLCVSTWPVLLLFVTGWGVGPQDMADLYEFIVWDIPSVCSASLRYTAGQSTLMGMFQPLNAVIQATMFTTHAILLAAFPAPAGVSANRLGIRLAYLGFTINEVVAAVISAQHYLSEEWNQIVSGPNLARRFFLSSYCLIAVLVTWAVSVRALLPMVIRFWSDSVRISKARQVRRVQRQELLRAEARTDGLRLFVRYLGHEVRNPLHAAVNCTDGLDAVQKQAHGLARLVSSVLPSADGGSSSLSPMAVTQLRRACMETVQVANEGVQDISALKLALGTAVTTLSDVLDYNKLLDGKLPVPRARFDLHNFLRRVSVQMSGFLSRGVPPVRLVVAADVPTTLVSSEMRLHQVLLNAGSNAGKAVKKRRILDHEGYREIVANPADPPVQLHAFMLRGSDEISSWIDELSSRRFATLREEAMQRGEVSTMPSAGTGNGSSFIGPRASPASPSRHPGVAPANGSIHAGGELGHGTATTVPPVAVGHGHVPASRATLGLPRVTGVTGTTMTTRATMEGRDATLRGDIDALVDRSVVLVITVRDSGAGLGGLALSHLFRDFDQAKFLPDQSSPAANSRRVPGVPARTTAGGVAAETMHTTTRTLDAGTGLGLALCRRIIVDSLHGVVGLADRRDGARGSDFIIMLPLPDDPSMTTLGGVDVISTDSRQRHSTRSGATTGDVVFAAHGRRAGSELGVAATAPPATAATASELDPDGGGFPPSRGGGLAVATAPVSSGDDDSNMGGHSHQGHHVAQVSSTRGQRRFVYGDRASSRLSHLRGISSSGGGASESQGAMHVRGVFDYRGSPTDGTAPPAAMRGMEGIARLHRLRQGEGGRYSGERTTSPSTPTGVASTPGADDANPTPHDRTGFAASSSAMTRYFETDAGASPSSRRHSAAYSAADQPVVKHEDADSDTRSEPAAGGGASATSLRVLVAEDDEANLRVLIRAVQRLGHSVHAVSDGIEVLDVFGLDGSSCEGHAPARGRPVRPSLFDVIFMDVHMTVLNGDVAARCLRRHGVKTPIVFCSGVAGLGSNGTLELVQPALCLTKPFGTSDVQRALAALAPQAR